MADVIREDDDNDEIEIVEDINELSDEAYDEQIARDDDDDVDSEREAIRERRRKEKLERKERKTQAISRDKLELDFLRKRNDDLERRVSVQEVRAHQTDLGAYDAYINQAAQEANMAERVIAKAVERGNGEDVAQAMRYRDQAIAKVQQLQFQKQQAAQQRPVAQPNQMDDLTMHYAKEFIADNPWYDAQGRDEDSSIVIAIDQTLAKDGFNPQTSEYWDELRKRAARRLPEKFGKKQTERTARGGPSVGSGREHAPTSTRKEMYVSPERKAALMEAGVWDDAVLRNKYLKRYAEYDRNNK
ncbi:hypothetical protein [Chromatium okenii]|uniref:hypothetical protein n=1 Tax=Chromatium okenii TaxID=61644 RepID=UPI0026E989E4|nr:hypothetical protein [Chromatium okenii]MBV5309071.1 hypothetical protein [Chromatium okenii]